MFRKKIVKNENSTFCWCKDAKNLSKLHDLRYFMIVHT